MQLKRNLPPNVITGGVDNRVVYHHDTAEFLANADVFPNPIEEVIITLHLTNPKQIIIKGYITGQTIIDLEKQGVDFIHSFIARQIPENENTNFNSLLIFQGTLQFSKFRWVVKDLEECGVEEFEDAGDEFLARKAAVDPKLVSVRSMIEESRKLGENGKYEAAINKLTTALSLNLQLEETDPEEYPATQSTKDRLEILATRSNYSFQMRAYRAAKRDCDLIESIFGQPIEAASSLDSDDATVYFEAMFRKAKALEIMGEMEEAAHGYLALMILKALSEGESASKTPVNNKIAEALTAKASESLKHMETDPNIITIYSLKIELRGVDLPVWRILEVTADTSLGELREYITAAMGWTGGMTHEFHCDDYGIVKFTAIPEQDEAHIDAYDEYESEAYTNVGKIVTAENDTFVYLYEDQKWIHDITVHAIRKETIKDHAVSGDLNFNESARDLPPYPKCIAGERACPPEELGPEGYAQFLRAVQNDEKTGMFDGKLKALEFAVETIGLTNTALDSWGGIKGKVHALKNKDGVSNDELGDPKVGGWDVEAFSIQEVNETLATLMGLEGWVSDEENE
ncbi:hypothetical protein HK098_007006 [Nowakowskiella sp. JEL0407]|nr:hypothetical protein HK098_007006 [Nowakowskiella sp. JEL0407]